MSGNTMLLAASRNRDGAWLCSVVPGCKGVAALQASAACDKCEASDDPHTHPVFACAPHVKRLPGADGDGAA